MQHQGSSKIFQLLVSQAKASRDYWQFDFTNLPRALYDLIDKTNALNFRRRMQGLKRSKGQEAGQHKGTECAISSQTVFKKQSKHGAQAISFEVAFLNYAPCNAVELIHSKEGGKCIQV